MVVEMQHRFTDAFSTFIFVGFLKCVIAKTWHRFTNVISTFFVIKFRSNEEAKGANGCEKMELLSSIDFP